VPAAQATGLPPKVVPCAPVGQRAMSSGDAPIADTGNPLAMPLAMAMTSGATPNVCAANHSPVRPNPVCTSSNTRSAP